MRMLANWELDLVVIWASTFHLKDHGTAHRFETKWVRLKFTHQIHLAIRPKVLYASQVAAIAGIDADGVAIVNEQRHCYL